ncbi:Anhydrotetracycline monooxygenase [Cladobotryum mycophilum]|uniref:Anhydrotetracycline monooxygenase n=1 Tax=Cladobotryum mycophilum TaxID=491253 RepID=A0ABR0SC32_9HYPO
MTVTNHPEVLIVGSGPTGLWLALELRRAQVDVLVIDTIPSREDRPQYSKAIYMSAGSLDIFNSRGEAQPFLDVGHAYQAAHFGFVWGLQFNKEATGTQLPYSWSIEQSTTESILLEKCDRAGVQFHWGTRFESLEQDGDHVFVQATRVDGSGPISYRARYLVGCDGTHSSVRKAVGIPFEGTPSTRTAIASDVLFAEKPTQELTTDANAKGNAFVLKLPGSDYYRVGGTVSTAMNKPASEKVTIEEVREHLVASKGTHYGAHSPRWMTRVGDACRQATRYQEGRVFIAGDAGHQFFPAGGQGMNLGFADATNLSWKLTAALRPGESEPSTIQRILDSYSTECVATGSEVIENIRVQSVMMRCETIEDQAIRSFMQGLLKHPEVNRIIARRLAVLEPSAAPYVPYADQDGSSVLGSRFTHLELAGDDGVKQIEFTDLSRFVLVIRADQVGSAAENNTKVLRQAISGFENRVSIVVEKTAAWDSKWDGVNAFMLRPDMHVAWTATTGQSSEVITKSLKTVLEYWWGA